MTDEAITPTQIKALFLVAFGHYPILDISESLEYHSYDDHGDIDGIEILRNFHILIDTEKLDIIDEFELYYVDRILEEVCKTKLLGKSHLMMEASKKYCFSDTEDWWEKISVENVPDGRERFDVIVRLG